MAVTHGKSGVLTVDSVLMPNTTSVSASFEVPSADATSMGDTWQVHTAGIPGGTIEFAGWFDPTAVTGNDTKLFTITGAASTVTWIWGPNGSASGAVKYSGSGFLARYQPGGEVASTTTYTATLQITGTVTRATYP